MNKKYIEVRFKLPVEDFAVYEAESNEARELGYDVSPTAQIKAETMKQAKIKRMILQIEPKTHKQSNN